MNHLPALLVSGRPRFPVDRYAVSVALVGIVFVLRAPIEDWAGDGNSPILYLPAVTLAAWFGGLAPGLFAALLGGALWVYLDISPTGSFFLSTAGDRFRVVVFAVEAVLLSALMEMLHAARRASERNAREAERYREALALDEDALRLERDFAERLIENAQVLVLVLDHHGMVERVNPFLERVSGRRPDEVRGSDWFARFVPDRDRLRARQAFRRALDHREGAHVIHAILASDGREPELEWTIRLLDGGLGDPSRVLAIGHDITDLKEAQGRAVQAERLAAIGQMVTGLAHESRNALQRSQACLEMLAFRLEDRAQELDLVSGIQDAQDDLQRLYEEVRTYAAPLTIERRPCRLGELLREAWGQLEWTLKNREARLVESGDEEARCLVDAPRMVQVFRNLLDNSLAACNDPVVVVVEWSKVELSGQAAIRVSLRDNGPGFPPERRRHLFEPFQTTKTQGTGLGMAIARRIVEAHGGSILAGDIDDGRPGAEVVITLPGGDA